MKRKTLATIGLVILTLLLVATVAQAYTIPSELRPENEPFDISYEDGEIGGTTATITILQIIAGTLLYFAAPLAVILIGLAAFDIVSGGADSEKLEQAKKNITWLIVGLLVIILSYSIVRFVISFVIKSAEVAS